MSDRVQLFSLGFLTLFLELVFIRFMAGNVWNLGYFPNLVLISAFIGLGAGFISHSLFSQKISGFLFSLTAPTVALFVFLICLISPAVPGFGGTGGSFEGEIFFTAAKPDESSANLFLFPFWFVFLTALFFLIAQRTAKVFMKMKPLTAYSFDILGSCFGIVAFLCISFLEIPAGVWFLLCIPVFLIAKAPSTSLAGKTAAVIIIISMLSASVTTFYQDRRHGERTVISVWSPYQKVDFKQPGKVLVNNIDHQTISKSPEMMYLYSLAQRVRARMSAEPYERVLVIGAGTGNDVVAALALGASEVTAVEIDPAIARLAEFRTVNPYSLPGVDLVIDDGRHFMTATERKYDLVIFALTDSLIKLSSLSQIRLESYLFTEESFSRAWSLLDEGETLMAVNFYREPWIPWKIGKMMSEVSGTEPVLYFATQAQG